MKVGLGIPEKYYGSVKGMLNVLLPKLEIERASEVINPKLIINSKLTTKQGIKVKSIILDKPKFSDQILDQEILNNCYNQYDFKKRCKIRVKLSIYRLLCDYLDQPLSPWGILIGVRPTKLVHSLFDRDFSKEKVDLILEEVYGIRTEKRNLLLRIIAKERSYLPSKEEAQKKVSLYLGIPFCPTRCAYCSFASYPFESYQQYVPDFLDALEYEIKKLGAAINELGLAIDTLYLGGGTPTVLSTGQLKRIINKLNKEFNLSDLREFSVEAGRPDTITKDKLSLLKASGVNRISINPQTMNQATLDKIERKHTIKQVLESFSLARELNFQNINMDLIIGLPGEEVADVKNSLEEIKRLNPDSLTIHTLALKRAAKMDNQVQLPSNVKVEKMLALTKQTAKDLNLESYYMYRQKYMLANLENIGYARSGLESIYNILMIEERQTVIGLGGGAITKMVNPKDWSLERLINPKFPKQYIEEVKERTDQKIIKLTSLVR
ncbi:coproporphyrinogen dehydrogenase HemZ [Halobacteroides halobius DSM 5150]|uniref:Coproporphyrinogen dehydrogenase HemZ n=1 Tax=Halobacteroides halobius (strain ATCC 35273 / DSM 5150 / MD-1) TaxID=748449 RepID=L0K8Z3_HALHC|nr:coproporphyrinogen dehydrogenase HemZ [Halobacteroides halobius]AGB41757.1 coproporphyrinogen dehydrogenase HemZ [Halobacteroides halobius DSM 5150]